MIKRVFIILIAILLCLSGCEAQPEDSVLGAYGSTDEAQEQSKLTEPTILYYPDMDSNPVTTTCLANNQVLKLVYRPLIESDASFKPQAVLAESFSQSENVVTVSLRQDLKFSNGEPLTAQHVVKSFEVAKKNADSPYNASAMQMSRFSAKDDYTFECVFKTVISDAAALMDIPIMYNGKEGIGCGPYKLETESGRLMLVANEYYPTSPLIKRLNFTETKTDDYITSMFSAGELDIVSIPGDDDLTLTSLRDYSIIKYPSNNLVYIGVNTALEQYADSGVRRAISAAIDRDKLSSHTLAGLAVPTEYPFNPGWYKLEGYVSERGENAGAVSFEGKELTLLVPEGSDVKTAVANALVSQLSAAGITLKLDIVPAADYSARVTAGNYELYLGETAVPRTMDATYLYGAGGSMNYCGYYNEELEAAFVELREQGTGLEKYLDLFSNQLPIIPVVYKMNAIYCANSLTGFSANTAWNSYGSFESVTIS